MKPLNLVRPKADRPPTKLTGLLKQPDETLLSDLDFARWLSELLDPVSWGEMLNKYGRTMKLAVALTDTRGNLLGPCYNPQPVWTLAQVRMAGPIHSCAFCLAPNPPCNAVTDAIATGKVVYAKDLAGLTHAAIPLSLGNHRLGAMIAGQSFSRYPQPIPLRRIAKHFAASESELWNAAVHQVPISQTTLCLYADLLSSFGQAFLRARYAAILDRELHQTSQQYQLMIEGSKDLALFTLDRLGSVTSWNPGAERLLGYAESEIRGKDYARFFTLEDVRLGVPKREIQWAEKNGRIEKESWYVRKDGTRFLSETITARLGDGDAREYGTLLHDVTEVRKSAEALLQAQKLESLGILAGGIAHDFNNLLTSILGNISLALTELHAGDSTSTLLGIAERSCLKAAALIAQLLAFTGNGSLTITEFDLSGLISEILPLIAGSIPQGVHLDLRVTPDLWMCGDSSEVQQIIMNLVINAAESHGPEGGSVRISTGLTVLPSRDESPLGSIYLEVQDTGCGMDETLQRRIFDPFFTTKFTGRGLGLAAVSGIVRRLNGSLDVKSEVGSGSTFRIVFPAVPARSPAAKVPTQQENDPHGTGLILVVDDDGLVRDLARAILERYGFSVLTAENGQVAIDIFRKSADTITAVLLDLTMPVMGGGDAFRLMNEIRPGIPIIISSGHGESAVREQFTGALAGVLNKPYSISDLREKIAAVLNTKTVRLSAGSS
jgi:PAS domain S-box-containing protein